MKSNVTFFSGVSGLNNKIGGVEFTTESIKRFTGNPLNEETIHTIKRDCEILLDFLNKNPKEMIAITSHISNGDMDSASDIASKILLSEEAFIKKGGGILNLLGAAIVLCILLCSKKAH